jgi:roadblock/LC7 domain-containing protein
MATLDELMQIEGVMAAGEFTPTGQLVDFKSSMSMPQDQASMTAQFCSTVSIMFNTLAKAYSHMYSNMDWLPPKFWAYGGGNVAVCVGGTKGVFLEIAKADFNELFKAFATDRAGTDKSVRETSEQTLPQSIFPPGK